jgi:thymidylate synthase (FAD)
MQKQEQKVRLTLEEIMQVKLMDRMGTDLTVVNAARVSFAKESEWESIPEGGEIEGLLSLGDENLIKYLAKHKHWSPFGHCSLQFHIKAPIFVARQLVKHQVGLVWNEVSRRYVDDEPEFYTPRVWRLKADNKKQGSSDETIEYDISGTVQFMKQTYYNLLREQVAPEMARMILPQNLYTEWYWSGTLMAFARVCNLRCAEDTQWETRQIANQIDRFGAEFFPYSWVELRKMT